MEEEEMEEEMERKNSLSIFCSIFKCKKKWFSLNKNVIKAFSRYPFHHSL